MHISGCDEDLFGRSAGCQAPFQGVAVSRVQGGTLCAASMASSVLPEGITVVLQGSFQIGSQLCSLYKWISGSQRDRLWDQLKSFKKFIFSLHKLISIFFLCPLCLTPTSDTQWLFLRGKCSEGLPCAGLWCLTFMGESS